MFCSNCGSPIVGNLSFCGNCGCAIQTQENPHFQEHIAAISSVWPEWQVVNQLGKGSYGVVYKAVRTDSILTNYDAIKVITVPIDQTEVKSLRSEGLDAQSTRTYFRQIVDDFVSEIQLMNTLKGVQNIVSVEDYKVVEHQNRIGWNIFIRMELLTPFDDYLCAHPMTREDIIALGCDICSALELCGQRQIIHRDIKPENIFVNAFGHFKLGDFGIARRLESKTSGLSQKGTFNYMAPEVATSNHYDHRVDIYSLGIVLYRLLNNNTLPFLTPENRLNPAKRKEALDRRLMGEPLLPPANADPALAEIVLKACAFNPNHRFADATQMKQALLQAKNGTYVSQSHSLDTTRSVNSTPPHSAVQNTVVETLPQVTATPQNKKNHKGLILFLVILLMVGILCGTAFVLYDKGVFDNSSPASTQSTLSEETSVPYEKGNIQNGVYTNRWANLQFPTAEFSDVGTAEELANQGNGEYDFGFYGESRALEAVVAFKASSLTADEYLNTMILQEKDAATISDITDVSLGGEIYRTVIATYPDYVSQIFARKIDDRLVVMVLDAGSMQPINVFLPQITAVIQ